MELETVEGKCVAPPDLDFSIGRRLSTRLFRSLEV